MLTNIPIYTRFTLLGKTIMQCSSSVSGTRCKLPFSLNYDIMLSIRLFSFVTLSRSDYVKALCKKTSYKKVSTEINVIWLLIRNVSLLPSFCYSIDPIFCCLVVFIILLLFLVTVLLKLYNFIFWSI